MDFGRTARSKVQKARGTQPGTGGVLGSARIVGEWTCTLQVPSRIRSAVRIAAKSVRFRTHRELKGFVGIFQTSRMRDQQGTEFDSLGSESRAESRDSEVP